MSKKLYFSFISICLFVLFSYQPSLGQEQSTKPATQPSTSPAKPCQQKTQNRQLDFWIGEWDVTSQAQSVATNSIQSILDGCVIFEQYTQGTYTGKSFSFYDSFIGKWRQTWIDSNGSVGEFTGEYKDGAMRFEGETHRSTGQKILRKMTVTKLDENRVRQYSEASTDGGKTWQVSYDFVYVRKK